MHIKRQVIDNIKKFRKSFLLIGPRQSGKSTLIKSLKPDLTINLSDQEAFLNYLKDPSLLKNSLRNNKTIFIDEVQRIPSLLNTVQFLIDSNPDLIFYLTGSSARKLKRGQANLLPGRVINYELGPLSASEIINQDNLDIKNQLSLGLLPNPFTEPNHELTKKMLRTYSATYLKEEVQAEALTKNLEGFSRFFDVIMGRAGTSIDFTKVSSQAMIERTSAKRYYDILIDTLIIHSIGPFTKSGKKRLIQHPKFYVFDVGVLNGALSNFNVSSDRISTLFEHLCLQLILSEAKGLDLDLKVSTYRTEAGVEVDFILEFDSKTIAVEIKATKKIDSFDLKGIRSFKKFRGNACEGVILYIGDTEKEVDGILIKPYLKGVSDLFK